MGSTLVCPSTGATLSNMGTVEPSGDVVPSGNGKTGAEDVPRA